MPELSQTMTGYLEAVQVAVVDEEQKGKTRSLVERFLDGGTGPKLQELLIEKQDKEENWVDIMKPAHVNSWIHVNVVRLIIGGWMTCT